MKNTYSIEAIKKFIDDVITKYNIDRNELDNQGAVYYCNGNDSTWFDFEANGRTCEFYVYWKNGDGAIKTMVAVPEGAAGTPPFWRDEFHYEVIGNLIISSLLFLYAPSV